MRELRTLGKIMLKHMWRRKELFLLQSNHHTTSQQDDKSLKWKKKNLTASHQIFPPFRKRRLDEATAPRASALAHVVLEKRNSCSQSISTDLDVVLSFFFAADVTQKTGTLATHSEEPAIVSNSTLHTYLVGRWFMSPPTSPIVLGYSLSFPDTPPRTHTHTNTHIHTLLPVADGAF